MRQEGGCDGAIGLDQRRLAQIGLWEPFEQRKLIRRQPAAPGEHAARVGALDRLGEELEQRHALHLETGAGGEIPPSAEHDGQQPQHAQEFIDEEGDARAIRPRPVAMRGEAIVEAGMVDQAARAVLGLPESAGMVGEQQVDPLPPLPDPIVHRAAAARLVPEDDWHEGVDLHAPVLREPA